LGNEHTLVGQAWVAVGLVVVVVVTGTSVVLVEVDSGQGVVGLAVTQEQRLPTAGMTLRASRPQESSTHEMPVSWMA
jgi:hypothetical protein